MTIKKCFGQLHLWLGLASGLVVLVVALTGSMLVFEKEIDEWLNKDFYFVAVPPGAQRLPVDRLLQQAREVDEAMKISAIQLATADPSRSVLFRGKKKGQTFNLAVNPYSGKVIKTVNNDRRFFTVVLQMHRYLLAGKTGKAITGVSCLIFLSLIITGLVLWWPKKRKALRQRMQIKWAGSGKRLNWDLHAVAGFYVHLILFVIALTGLTWSYKWFNNGLFMLLDGKPQQKFVAPLNQKTLPVATGYFEKLYRQTNQKLPYKGQVNISLPEKKEQAITVSKTNFEAGRSNVVDFLYFETSTGHLLQERLYKNESRGMYVRRLVYPIHTGNIYGWPTKIIAFISSLVAASLPITGLRIWLGRRKKAKKTVAERVQAGVDEGKKISFVD